MQIESSTSRQDWTLFGLRWVYLIAISAAIILARGQGFSLENNGDVLRAFVIGVIANLLYALFIPVDTLKRLLPAIIILGDWGILGSFINASGNNPLLMVTITSAVVICGALRLGLVWGLVHSIGALLITFGVPYFTLGSRFVVNDFTLPMLILGLVVVVTLAWTYTLEHHIKEQREDLHRLATSTAAELAGMRERTRAIYEMSTTLNATLNYEKILEATLTAGRMALRELEGQRTVSAVMLFRAQDNSLQVATARGMSRADLGKSVPGKDGILATALSQATPTVGKNAGKDPELQYFVSFQDVKSILCIPLRAGYNNYGLLIYGSDARDAFTEEHGEMLTAVGTQATIALQNAVLYRNLIEEKDRIIEVEEEARKALARDLHDGPTQTISAITMHMSIISRMLTKAPAEVPSELKKVEDMARRTTEEIRHLLFKLRPLIIETQGLTAALNQLAEKMKETYSQAVSVYVAREAEMYLDKNQQSNMFSIIEEAVNNARKYAQAKMININISRSDDLIIVQILDNGVGFDPEQKKDQGGGRGLGTTNMHERAALMEGSLQIESAPNRGTTITLLVPVKDQASITASRIEREKSRPRRSKTMTKLEVEALARIEAINSR
jgi:signal transduction histidine kinase